MPGLGNIQHDLEQENRHPRDRSQSKVMKCYPQMVDVLSAVEHLSFDLPRSSNKSKSENPAKSGSPKQEYLQDDDWLTPERREAHELSLVTKLMCLVLHCQKVNYTVLKKYRLINYTGIQSNSGIVKSSVALKISTPSPLLYWRFLCT